MVKDAAALETVAADPAHWLITEHGLAVSFNFQEVDLNEPGGVDVEIPWSALKPYLVQEPSVLIASK